MEIKIRKKEENYIELELGQLDPSFGNTLASIILRNKDVEFCTLKIEHPQSGNPVLIVRTKKTEPIEIIKKATEELKDEIKELQKGLKSK
ncbi:MAG: RpoL/Rpb11 RNA polymerase subunit family protein [Candidatus Anstonellaceae archaeon]